MSCRPPMWEPPLTLRQGMRNLPFTEDPPKEENVIGCFTERYHSYISLEDVHYNMGCSCARCISRMLVCATFKQIWPWPSCSPLCAPPPDVPRLLVLCLLCQGLVRQLHEEHHHAAGEEIRHPQLSDRRHWRKLRDRWARPSTAARQNIVASTPDHVCSLFFF